MSWSHQHLIYNVTGLYIELKLAKAYNKEFIITNYKVNLLKKSLVCFIITSKSNQY